MKRLLLLLALIVGFAPNAFAQHSAALSWQASPTSGVTYNVYRAPCTGTVTSNVCSQEGTFSKLSNVSALAYTDSAVTAGALYSWYITAVDSGGESSGSNHFAAAIPGGSVGGGPVTFVQLNYATPQNSPTSVPVSFTHAQTAGNTNIIVIGWNNTTSTVTGVTDTAGNAYTIAVQKISAGGLSQAIYIANSIFSAAANTVTVTFNAATFVPDIRIAEYSGIATTSPIDIGSSGSGSTSTATSPAVVTQNANDILIGAAMTTGVVSGAGTGYTSRIITSPSGDNLEDKLVTATGTYTATAPVSGSWLMQMVALKAAGGVIQPTVTSVTTTCSPTSITTVQTSQCSATVQGTNNPPQTVTWAATGGTVNSSGLFTPSTTGTAVVIATSTFDTTKHGSANITVTAPVASLVLNCSYSSSTGRALDS